MQHPVFINYYEVLDLEVTASGREVERAFRQLARRFHPDNQDTGDRDQFDVIVEAHRTLAAPGKRAQYHADHTEHLPPLPPQTEDAPEAAPETEESEAFIDGLGIDRDLAIQNHILTLLYQRRRHSIREPGVGEHELEELSGCPPEHLEFHLWYLKEKGWVKRREDGLMAITIEGVDRAAGIYREMAARMITDRT